MRKKIIKKHLDNSTTLANLLEEYQPSAYFSRKNILVISLIITIFLLFLVVFLIKENQKKENLLNNIQISQETITQPIIFWLLLKDKKIHLTELTDKISKISRILSQGTFIGSNKQNIIKNPNLNNQQGLFLGNIELNLTTNPQAILFNGETLGNKKLHSTELQIIIKNIIISSYLLNQIDLLDNFSINLQLLENSYLIGKIIPNFPQLKIGPEIGAISSINLQSFISESTLLHKKIQETLQIPLIGKMNQIYEDKTETVDTYIYYLKALREEALNKLRTIYNYKETLSLQNKQLNLQIEQITKLLSNAIQQGNEIQATFYSQQYSEKNLTSSKIKTNYRIYNKLYQDLEKDIILIRDRLSQIYERYINLVL